MNINLKTFLLLTIVVQSSANFNIEANIPFCAKTDVLVDLETSCNDQKELLKKMICANELNDIKQVKESHNNEFKYIFTLNEKKMFYFLNSNAYVANCDKVDSFEIIENVDSCTVDVPVMYKKNGKTQKGFLTKEEIIREESTITDCKDENFLIIDDGKFELIKKHKKNDIERKAKSLGAKYIVETGLNMQNKNPVEKLLLGYENSIEFNPIFQFSKDVATAVVFIVVFILIIVFSINKKKTLNRLIKSMINVYFNRKQNYQDDIEQAKKTRGHISNYDSNDLNDI